jgi:hypothetical protein
LILDAATASKIDYKEDLRVADVTRQPQPHWVATDQIVTIDTTHGAIRHLATVVNAEKVRRVDESLRLLLNR